MIYRSPPELDWFEFSRMTLDKAAKTKRSVYFDLTYIEDLKGVLAGTGQYADTITGQELRYIVNNSKIFKPIVTFFYKSKVYRLFK